MSAPTAPAALPRTLDDIDAEFLKTDEVASILRVGPEWVQQQCKAGHIPARKLGREWRIHRDTVRQLANPGDNPSTRARGRRNSRQRRSP